MGNALFPFSCAILFYGTALSPPDKINPTHIRAVHCPMHVRLVLQRTGHCLIAAADIRLNRLHGRTTHLRFIKLILDVGRQVINGFDNFHRPDAAQLSESVPHLFVGFEFPGYGFDRIAAARELKPLLSGNSILVRNGIVVELKTINRLLDGRTRIFGQTFFTGLAFSTICDRTLFLLESGAAFVVLPGLFLSLPCETQRVLRRLCSVSLSV